MNLRALLTLLVILGAPASALAHRVDEYLQATLLSVDTQRVDVEMNLTPGIALASEVFAWIDTNRDGEISGAEGEAYARQVLHSAVLSVDGKPVPLALVDSRFPAFRDMRLGVGTIRLRAIAAIPAAAAGHHRISFSNTHRPDSSVYLVNALVPANPRVHLAEQQRDRAQHSLTLDYTVTADAPSAWTFVLLAGFLLAARLLLRYRRVLNPAFHETDFAEGLRLVPSMKSKQKLIGGKRNFGID